MTERGKWSKERKLPECFMPVYIYLLRWLSHKKFWDSQAVCAKLGNVFDKMSRTVYILKYCKHKQIDLTDSIYIFHVLRLTIHIITGYLASPHSANIPLQQQLQHANEKAGFNDGEKYKMQQVMCFASIISL